MSITAYPNYDNYTQQHWIGNSELPSHWAIKPLKHEADIVLGKMLCPENKGGYSLKPYLKSKNVQWLCADVSSVDEMWFSPREMGIYRLRLNDLVLSEGGEVGKTCIWQSELEECYIQNSAHKVTMGPQNDARFHLYQFYAFGKYGGFDAAVNRVSIAHLTYEKLANINFAFPPLPEQRAIAAFLDGKCATIDDAVRIKEEQITLLRERRQILIQQTVTRGLNESVPMKDSGIDWIGQIPAHWEVKRGKHLFREVNERSEEGAEELLSVSHTTGVTARSEKNVNMFLAEDYSGSKLCQPGDIVINTMWAWMGALGVSDLNGIISPSYGVYRALAEGSFNRRFLEWLLRTTPFIEQYNKISTGLHSSRLRLYPHMFLGLFMAFPDREEQDAIVEYVEREAGKIDRAIALKESQISALREYKVTLINAAVTGKIKVI